MSISSAVSHLLDFTFRFFLGGLVVFGYFIAILSPAALIGVFAARHVFGIEDDREKQLIPVILVTCISAICYVREVEYWFPKGYNDVFSEGTAHVMLLVTIIVETVLICGMFLGMYSLVAFAWRRFAVKSSGQGSREQAVPKEIK